MFKCQFSGKSSKSGEKEKRFVVQKRVKEYPKRIKANRGYKFKNGHQVRSKSNSDRVDDPGGRGWEIQKEIRVCAAAEKEFLEAHPTAVPI